MTVLGHQRGEDAFAQAAVRHAQAPAGPDPEQGLENSTARKHEIGALPTDARLRHAVSEAHGKQAEGDGPDVARTEPAAFDPGTLIGRQPEMNPGNGGDGSRSAEE